MDWVFMHELALAGSVIAVIIVCVYKCLVANVLQGVKGCCQVIEELKMHESMVVVGKRSNSARSTELQW